MIIKEFPKIDTFFDKFLNWYYDKCTRYRNLKTDPIELYYLVLLSEILSFIKFKYKRIICWYKGCNVVTYIPYNIPDGYYDRECTRCCLDKSDYGASYDYGYEFYIKKRLFKI